MLGSDFPLVQDNRGRNSGSLVRLPEAWRNCFTKFDRPSSSDIDRKRQRLRRAAAIRTPRAANRTHGCRAGSPSLGSSVKSARKRAGIYASGPRPGVGVVEGTATAEADGAVVSRRGNSYGTP